MRSALRRRPSASMIVALVALVVAMSGSAVAASRLVNGDKLIRKRTLSGNRLRKHTLTGTQINLKKLGTVPKAKSAASARHAASADTAGHATSADTAGHATSADSATNAASLGGRPASGYLTTADRIGTGGVVKVARSASGNTVTVATVGQFTVTLTCTKTGSGDTTLDLDATAREAGADVDGVFVTGPDESVSIGHINATGAASDVAPYAVDFEAPSGAQAMLNVVTGVNSLGTDCWTNMVGLA